MHKTGPKISSLAIVISFVTFEKIVGFTKNPFSSPSGKSVPPQTRVAPSSIPISISLFTFSYCVLLEMGPILTPSSFGFPTTIELATFLAISIASSY